MDAAAIPGWFQCDEIFGDSGQWFIGSEHSLHIGPYADEEVAKTKSDEFCRKLKKLVNDGDRLRYVRKLLSQEWDAIGSDAHVEAEEISLEAVEEQVRYGEDPKKWYRSKRFYQVDGVWFFSTREGLDVGPFDSESDAQKHSEKLKSLLIKCSDEASAKKTILEYKHRPEKLEVEYQGYKNLSQNRF
ncbi:MAG: hypothetical protein GKR90_21970 [Pseudomonadales bacterium]|nr:hypothetical protein [Pseudomonadales bacterium]